MSSLCRALGMGALGMGAMSTGTLGTGYRAGRHGAGRHGLAGFLTFLTSIAHPWLPAALLLADAVDVPTGASKCRLELAVKAERLTTGHRAELQLLFPLLSDLVAEQRWQRIPDAWQALVVCCLGH